MTEESTNDSKSELYFSSFFPDMAETQETYRKRSGGVTPLCRTNGTKYQEDT